MVENVIQIKIGITNVDSSVKIRRNMCAQNIIFRIAVHVLVKTVNIQEVL